jgi:signal transduction histidine kinase
MSNYVPRRGDSALLSYLLAQISAQVDADAAAIVDFDRETKRAHWAARWGAFDHTAPECAEHQQQEEARLLRRLRDVLAAIKPSGSPSYDPFAVDLDSALWRSALTFPLSMPDQVIGLAVLFSKRHAAFDPERISAVQPLVNAAGKVLENDHLHNLRAENLATAQSILVAAQAIAEDTSPQNVVDILQMTLFSPRVTSCALLLYGPQRENASPEPFEYLEIAGSWSRRHGSGIGTGVRLYLRDHRALLDQLERERILTFQNARRLLRQLDPLSRVFMLAERLRAVTLIGLRSAHYNLGVMVIGTSQRHAFNDRELRSYFIVSEFLAISALAQLLRQQHDRLQQARAALMDAVTDGVVMTLPGARGGIVLTINKRFTRMFAVSERRAQGLALEDLLELMSLPEDVRAELRTAWLTVPADAPRAQQGSFQSINADGLPLEVEWYSAPVYENEQVLGRIYTFHDVTAERTAMRMRARFLSGVSHELRTPLTSIRGFAEFILEQYADQLPSVAREYMEIIRAQAHHLNNTFRDLIDLTRADAGELRLNKTDAHLPDIIIDAVAGMEMQFRGRKQRVIMEIDDDLPPVHADVDRIMQTINNLLSNANKYAPEGSRITISTEVLYSAETLPASAPPDVTLPAVMVTIADEGRGLSPEEAVQVFQPFYRTDAARKAKIEGSGLGLAVTRGIVEMHRGKIWAEARTVGSGGGVFRFTLPISSRALENSGR